MRILMLNWRDLKNPRSGGAEVVTEEVLRRLALRGHEVTLFTSMFPGAVNEETINGYRVVRRGSEFTVHIHAFFAWVFRFRKEHFDVVVDQVHGIPFFTPLYIRRVPIVGFIHEVAREIWLRMYPFPIGRIGYTLERFFFVPYRYRPFLTVSHATVRDLVAVGVDPHLISIIPEAIAATPSARVPSETERESDPTILFVGRVAKMKGVGDLIRAYHIARERIPNLKLWIVGGGDAYKAELEATYKNDSGVTFFGFVSEDEKRARYARAHLLSSASMKEGFGLVVIEAAACGTPSVVYNVDGFNEAVKDGQTGVLTGTTPEALAESMVSLLIDTPLARSRYSTLAEAALSHSRTFTFDTTTDAFEQHLARAASFTAYAA
jgi:glycosyltransferase involved in cell wall biosynthesis